MIQSAKNSVRPRKNTAEGGCGGNSAVFLQKIEASPAALLGESRTQQKSFLSLLEEDIRRAQNQKCRENFFAGWLVVASGGGLASLVWFRSAILDKIGSSGTVKTHPIGLGALQPLKSLEQKPRFSGSYSLKYITRWKDAFSQWVPRRQR